ncbi:MULTISPECIES: class I SAM-dependent methyltransferase [unclassified Clostridium]|uniref:class I SAM-dependent methyltransferase n=1 Tax=unclassified Clostridium TaxID=2614128 RepID=UPI0025C5F7C4|nr:MULTISPECIES: class I SAM-dependent methyltransferase [unclassified Clostridium]
MKEQDINMFNELSSQWKKNIPEKNYIIAKEIIENLNIVKGQSLLDVACGTGILYPILKNTNLSKYTAMDITEKMVSEFLKFHPNTDVRLMDFEEEVTFKEDFDYIIIFNSIPHFYDLNTVFKNAYNNLNPGGKFIIVHCRTREELKERRKLLGYTSINDPIPIDSTLVELCNRYDFKEMEIKDTDYFYFCCEK